MTDIVDKLRIDRWTPREESQWRKIAKDAATEIEQLRAALATIREAFYSDGETAEQQVADLKKIASDALSAGQGGSDG